MRRVGRLTKLWWIAIEAVRCSWECRIRIGFPWGLLPIPPKIWVAWRLDTAYGEGRWPSWRRILSDGCVFLLWRRKIRKEIESR